MPSPSSSQPYRTRSLQCPRCHVELGSEVVGQCTRCRGAWVPEDALRERVGTMQRAPARIHWHRVERAAVPCVACRDPMETLMLFDVPVDRCQPHGIWFDADELALVLYRSPRSKYAAATVAPAMIAATAPVMLSPDPRTSSSVGAELAIDGAFLATEVSELALETAVPATQLALEATTAGLAEVGVQAAAGIVESGGGEIAGAVLEAILEAIASVFF